MLALVSVILLQAVSRTPVFVTLDDGSHFHATARMEKLRLRNLEGITEVPISDLRSLVRGERGGFRAHTRGGTVDGLPGDEELHLEAEFGSAIVPYERLLRLSPGAHHPLVADADTLGAWDFRDAEQVRALRPAKAPSDWMALPVDLPELASYTIDVRFYHDPNRPCALLTSGHTRLTCGGAVTLDRCGLGELPDKPGWISLTLVRDATRDELLLYVNGAATAVNSNSRAWPAGSPTLGSSRDPRPTAIAWLRISKRARTDDEVQAEHTVLVPPAPAAEEPGLEPRSGGFIRGLPLDDASAVLVTRYGDISITSRAEGVVWPARRRPIDVYECGATLLRGRLSSDRFRFKSVCGTWTVDVRRCARVVLNAPSTHLGTVVRLISGETIESTHRSDHVRITTKHGMAPVPLADVLQMDRTRQGNALAVTGDWIIRGSLGDTRVRGLTVPPEAIDEIVCADLQYLREIQDLLGQAERLQRAVIKELDSRRR